MSLLRWNISDLRRNILLLCSRYSSHRGASILLAFEYLITMEIKVFRLLSSEGTYFEW